jgi:hypothetical protein
MTDLYLKTPTEAEMTAALLAAGVTNDEGNPVSGVSLDHIGLFSRVTGYDKADEPIVVDYPGWHTNLRGSFSDEQLVILGTMAVNPAIPFRMFAGGGTA